jgi:hypothetical protein
VKTKEVALSKTRAILIGLTLIIVAIGLAASPILRLIMATVTDATGELEQAAQSPSSIDAMLALGIIGLIAVLIAIPGLMLLSAVRQGLPLLKLSAERIDRIPLGFGRTHIEWAHISDIGLRGVWIILIDNRVLQNKLLMGLVGAKGLWIPAILAEGGGAKVMAAIHEIRPDLLDKLARK